MITIVSSSRYLLNRKKIRKAATEFLINQGVAEGNEVNIVFAGKNKLRELSKKYKQEDVALPVLSFVYNEESDGKKYLGEILICYPQAVLMAAQKNKTVDEIIERLVKHGLENILNHI